MMTQNDNHDCPENIAVIRGGAVVNGCELCINSKQSQGVSANYERNYQRREYAKDIVQPNQPREFLEAHGADVAREHGYTDETLRKYG